MVRRLLKTGIKKSRPTDKIRRLEGSAVGEVPLALRAKSETMVFAPTGDAGVVDGNVSGAVFCERRLAAVLKVEVRLAVESDVELSEGTVEPRRLDELTVCTGCKAHSRPGQTGPAENEEAEHVAPRRRVDATAR